MPNPDLSETPIFTIRCDTCRSKFSPLPKQWSADEINSYARRNPSHVEIAHAKKAVVEEETQLLRYDAEIRRLGDIIRRLRAGQSLLQKQLDIHRSWAAPIQNLPPEILMEIFEYACLSEEHALTVTSRGRKIHSPPFTISHVSSRWRRLARDRPHLWTSISIDLYRHRRDVRPLLKLFLQNSRNKPLRLELLDSKIAEFRRLCWNNEDYTACHLGIRALRVFTLLMESSHRVESLSAQVDWEILKSAEICSSSPPSDVQCRFPILREFRSFDAECNNETEFFRIEEAFARWFVRNGLFAAPRLRILRIHELSEETPFPYHQLTRLELEWDVDPDNLLDVLSKCINLEYLEIRQFNGSDAIEIEPVTVQLASLRFLSIEIGESGILDVGALYSSLILPSLGSLELCYNLQGIGLFPLFHPFSPGTMMDHFSDVLKDLTLSFSLYIALDHVLEILEKCPNLETLQLHITPSHHDNGLFSHLTGNFVRRLTLPIGKLSGEHDPPLLPKLQILFLHVKSPPNGGPTDVGANYMIHMVESRSQQVEASPGEAPAPTIVTPFRKVAFSFCDMDERDLEDVEDCRGHLNQSLQDRIGILEEKGTTFLMEWASTISAGPIEVPAETESDSELDDEDEDEDEDERRRRQLCLQAEMTKAVQTRLTHYFSNRTTGQIDLPRQTFPPPPALKLPDELWVHVFSYVCANERFIPRETRRDNDALHNTTAAPFRSIRQILRLSLICHRLRDIIHSTPSLWSTISLNIRRANATPILQLILQRALCHPLNIEITDTRSALHGEDTQVQSNHEHVRLLLGAAQRWRSLRLLLGTSWDIFKEPEGALSPAFPLLESLRLDHVFDLERRLNNQTPHWLRDGLQSAPRLTTLITRNAAVLDILPCHQLTSLEIRYLSGTPERVAQILQTCPNLTALSLDCWLAKRATHDQVNFISEDRDDDLERAVVGFLWKLAVRPSKRASRAMTVFLPKLLGIKLRHSSSSEGVMNAAQDGLKHLASSRSRANLEALGCLGDILPLVSTQLTSERDMRLRLPDRDYIDLTMLSDSETDDDSE
ncbi:hypothetical protein VNI00_014620 [Paramarasmius palmivorus]|uniref:F-box domain-containing protein n=1 Tax=Paramarasmius palmivorus TaxID=297713 RepID=A0AAW0BRV5_9AGAR